MDQMLGQVPPDSCPNVSLDKTLNPELSSSSDISQWGHIHFHEDPSFNPLVSGVALLQSVLWSTALKHLTSHNHDPALTWTILELVCVGIIKKVSFGKKKSCCLWICDKSLTVIKTHFPLQRRSSEQENVTWWQIRHYSLAQLWFFSPSAQMWRKKQSRNKTTDTVTVICFWSKNLTQKNYFRISPTEIVLKLSDCRAWTLPPDSTPTQRRGGAAFLDFKDSIPQWPMLVVEFGDFGSTNAIKRIFVSFLWFCPSSLFTVVPQPGDNMCSLVKVFHWFSLCKWGLGGQGMGLPVTPIILKKNA